MIGQIAGSARSPAENFLIFFCQMPIIVTGAKNKFVGIHAQIKSTEIILKTAWIICQKLSVKRDKNCQPHRISFFTERKMPIITGNWLPDILRHDFCYYDDRHWIPRGKLGRNKTGGFRNLHRRFILICGICEICGLNPIPKNKLTPPPRPFEGPGWRQDIKDKNDTSKTNKLVKVLYFRLDFFVDFFGLAADFQFPAGG